MQKIWVCGARGQIGQAVNDVVDKLIREQSASGQRKKQLTIF